MDKKRGGVHSCPPGGGPLNVHVDQNLAIAESMYFIPLFTVMGEKRRKKVTLNILN